MSKQKLIVLWVLFLDILSIGIMIPLTPDVIDWFNTSDTMVTLWLTVYSFFAFFAAPILGQLSDKYGRKSILALCVWGTALSFLVLMLSHNIVLFFLTRLVNGITWWNVGVLNAIMNDISENHQDRAKNFGLVGAIFGLGFIVWPLAGSLLIPFGLRWVFFVTFLLAFIELVFLWIFMKETNKQPARDRVIAINPFPIFAKYLFRGDNNFIFRAIFFTWAATFSFQSILSIVLDHTYGIDTKHIGYLMAGVGLISVINSGFLIPKFRLKKWQTKQLVYAASISNFIFFALMIFFTGKWQLIILWFLSIPLSGVGQAVNSAEVIKHSDKSRIWETNWFIWSIQAFVMFVGPLIGTLSLQRDISVYYFCALFLLIAFVFMRLYFKGEEEKGILD